MDSSKSEVTHDFFPLLRVYRDGHVERLMGTETVPPSVDPQTGVSSKDVIIVPETGVSARLYLPKIANPNQKLPLLVYFHGGAFCVESAFSPTYHRYLNALTAEANVVTVSVDYRLAPEHPLPIAYEDSWTALKWVVSHSNGEEPEAWLKEHVDFGQVFLAGDSAGANIAHNMAIRDTENKLGDDVKLAGMILIHPYFGGTEPVGPEVSDLEKKEMEDKFWLLVYPSKIGCDDPLCNPAADHRLAGIGCRQVLVFVAEKDFLRDRGRFYYEKLGESRWGGDLEIVETEGENHVFHLMNPPNCEKSVEMMKRLVFFINESGKEQSLTGPTVTGE